MLFLFFARIKNSNHVECWLPLVNFKTLRERIGGLLFSRTMRDANIWRQKSITKPLNIDFMVFTQMAQVRTISIRYYLNRGSVVRVTRDGIAVPSISDRNCCAGIASLNRAVASAMASASVVERLHPVCLFDWNEIGEKDEPPEMTSTEPDVE